MGRFWRRNNNIFFFMDLESYLREHGAPLALLLVSSGLVVYGTFGMLGLASDEASGFSGYMGNQTWHTF